MSDESTLYKQAIIRIDKLVEEVMQICDEVAEKTITKGNEYQNGLESDSTKRNEQNEYCVLFLLIMNGKYSSCFKLIVLPMLYLEIYSKCSVHFEINAYKTYDMH